MALLDIFLQVNSGDASLPLQTDRISRLHRRPGCGAAHPEVLAELQKTAQLPAMALRGCIDRIFACALIVIFSVLDENVAEGGGIRSRDISILDLKILLALASLIGNTSTLF
jgi:hypothetical protein